MNSTENYFCWIRLLPPTGEASLLPQVEAAGKLALKMVGGRLDVKAGPRPPYRVTAEPTLMGASRMAGTAPRGPAGFWFADGHFRGEPKADTVFDYGPAYTVRDAAISWIGSNEGRRWVAESLNYFLFCFERVSGDEGDDPPQTSTVPDVQATTGSP